MWVKNMHQIAQIELRNAKLPYARGLCPLATPARVLCPSSDFCHKPFLLTGYEGLGEGLEDKLKWPIFIMFIGLT